MKAKKRAIRYWRNHMDLTDRHPACPSVRHVGDFIDKRLNDGIGRGCLLQETRIISNMFDYWSGHPNMPHGQGESEGYNPIESALKLKMDDINKRTVEEVKPQHSITVERIGQIVRGIKNLLHRGVIATQFKYGIRVGQTSRIMLQDVKINHPGLQDLYPTLGTNPKIQNNKIIKNHNNEVIYFPSRHERKEVKSQRPTLMPIDSEMRRVLIQYLCRRPKVDHKWLFANNSSGGILDPDLINDSIWKAYFHPEYSETPEYDSVTSHYARHRFGTYWKKEVGANVELIKYMRGDKQDNFDGSKNDILDTYIHTYYQDIRDLYLNNIYKLSM